MYTALPGRQLLQGRLLPNTLHFYFSEKQLQQWWLLAFLQDRYLFLMNISRQEIISALAESQTLSPAPKLTPLDV